MEDYAFRLTHNSTNFNLYPNSHIQYSVDAGFYMLLNFFHFI